MAFDFKFYTKRKALPPFPSVFGPVPSLANDPARMKSGFVGTSGVDPGYVNRVEAFNRDLYRPGDTKPRTAAMLTFLPLSTSRKTQPVSGWQTPGAGDLGRIAAQYRGTPSGLPPAYPNPNASGEGLRTVSANPSIQPQDESADIFPEDAQTGSAGPTGDSGVPAYTPIPMDQTARAVMPSVNNGGLKRIDGSSTPDWFKKSLTDTSNSLGATPNDTQGGGMPAGDQTNYKNVTDRIDARATRSSRDSNASDDIQSHWGWAPF